MAESASIMGPLRVNWTLKAQRGGIANVMNFRFAEAEPEMPLRAPNRTRKDSSS
jgi:hypothetical protein